MMNDPVPLTVAPITRSFAPFLDWNRLAGHHRLIDGAFPLDHNAIDRDLLAGTHSKPIAGTHVLERHVFFVAIFANPTCRLRGQAEQRTYRRACVTARAQLHDLSQQHQRDDDGCGFEVDADGAALISE